MHKSLDGSIILTDLIILCTQDKSQVGMSELVLRQPIPGMGKFVLMSGNPEKKPYAEEHFKANGTNI